MIEKRKFSGKRLYKLIRVLILIITFISALILMLSIYMYNVGASEIFKMNEAICDNYPSIDFECTMKALEIFSFWQNSLVLFGIITFGLPSTFFGGVGIYRYLFPKVETK